jgi:hypothetical protein
MTELTQCPTCKGTGKITIRSVEYRSDGIVSISCIWCDGKGKQTPAEKQKQEDFNNAWCKCGNPSGEVNYYHHMNGAHGYTCADCGKIIQTG